MGEAVNSTLDDDLYNQVVEEFENTGMTKSQVVNYRVRKGYELDGIDVEENEPTLGDSILPEFGQGLFVAGWVVAYFSPFIAGVGISLLGLGLFVGAKVDEHMQEYDVPATKALFQVLGA